MYRTTLLYHVENTNNSCLGRAILGSHVRDVFATLCKSHNYDNMNLFPRVDWNSKQSMIIRCKCSVGLRYVRSQHVTSKKVDPMLRMAGSNDTGPVGTDDG